MHIICRFAYGRELPSAPPTTATRPQEAISRARPREPLVASHGVCAYNRVDKSAGACGAGRDARQGMPAGRRRLRPALRSRRAGRTRPGWASLRARVRPNHGMALLRGRGGEAFSWSGEEVKPYHVSACLSGAKVSAAQGSRGQSLRRR